MCALPTGPARHPEYSLEFWNEDPCSGWCWHVGMSWAVGLHWARPQRLWRLRFHSWNTLAVKYPLLLSRGIRQICLPKLQLGNLTYLGHCLEHWSFKQALRSEGRLSWYFHFLKDEKKLKVTHVKIFLMRLTWSRKITSREK